MIIIYKNIRMIHVLYAFWCVLAQSLGWLVWYFLQLPWPCSSEPLKQFGLVATTSHGGAQAAQHRRTSTATPKPRRMDCANLKFCWIVEWWPHRVYIYIYHNRQICHNNPPTGILNHRPPGNIWGRCQKCPLSLGLEPSMSLPQRASCKASCNWIPRSNPSWMGWLFFLSSYFSNLWNIMLHAEMWERFCKLNKDAAPSSTLTSIRKSQHLHIDNHIDNFPWGTLAFPGVPCGFVFFGAGFFPFQWSPAKELQHGGEVTPPAATIPLCRRPRPTRPPPRRRRVVPAPGADAARSRRWWRSRRGSAQWCCDPSTLGVVFMLMLVMLIEWLPITSNINIYICININAWIDINI